MCWQFKKNHFCVHRDGWQCVCGDAPLNCNCGGLQFHSAIKLKSVSLLDPFFPPNFIVLDWVVNTWSQIGIWWNKHCATPFIQSESWMQDVSEEMINNHLWMACSHGAIRGTMAFLDRPTTTGPAGVSPLLQLLRAWESCRRRIVRCGGCKGEVETGPSISYLIKAT